MNDNLLFHVRENVTIIYNLTTRRTYIVRNSKEVKQECFKQTQGRKEKINILKIKIPVFKNIVASKIKISQIKIRKVVNVLELLCIPMFIIGLVCIGINLETIKAEILLIGDMGNKKLMLSIVVVFAISTLFHEVGHLLAALSEDLLIGEIGFMLYWFMPCAYTTICGISLVDNKHRRLRILMSGINMNLFISGIFLVIMSVINKFKMIMLLAIGVNMFLALSNLLVFLKLDGYYVLEQLLEIKNLREKSFDCVIRKNIDNIDNKELYWVYCLLSILYIPITLCSIIVGAFP